MHVSEVLNMDGNFTYSILNLIYLGYFYLIFNVLVPTFYNFIVIFYDLNINFRKFSAIKIFYTC